MTFTENALPAAFNQPVTERHARMCRTDGHLSYLVDGVDNGICPRCGDVKGDRLYAHTAEQWDVFSDMMLKDTFPGVSAYDLAAMLVKMGGDHDIMYSMADRYRWSFGRYTTEIPAPAELEAWDRRDV
jgi:hypothetical protein